MKFAALTRATLTLGTATLVSSAKVTFVNKCSHPIDLWDNSVLQSIAAGESSAPRELPRGSHPMFRHGKNPEATLAEFTIDGDSGQQKAWFDISTVIPGSGNCKSVTECKQVTGGKSGFNVAVAMIPKTNENKAGFNCVRLTCLTEDCADAYKWPTDDVKTKSCPIDTEFEVVYCPGGSDGDGGSTTTSAPPSTSSPAPSASSQTPTFRPPTQNPPTQKPSTRSPIAQNDNHGTKKNSTSTPAPAGTAGKKTASTSTAQVKSSFTYKGENVGNYAGSYQMVETNGVGAACQKSSVNVNYKLGPMSEEASVAFRGPMVISNIAVFDGSSGSDWTRVSNYDGSSADNMVFLNNKNIDYTGGKRSPQGYANADATDTAKEATLFGGKLADGVEMHIMTGKKCSEGGECKGFKDDMSYHGWDGGKKVFLTKVQMPYVPGAQTNRPAVWMLNAQVVRSAQYGCNCRGMGGAGGCGELDIAEVIETNDKRDAVSTHYYFYDGKATGQDNYGKRPADEASIYATIFDETAGVIKIVEIDGNGFDFSANAISQEQIDSWLK